MIRTKASLKGKVNTKSTIKGKVCVGIERIYPVLENLTVTPSGEEQVFNHENSYGYDEVRVEAVPSEALEVNPTTENQEFDGMYNNVKVNAVTNEIDSNIVAENIKDGVEILGLTGTLQEGITPSGELAINDNGVYDVTNYASANVEIEKGITPTGTLDIIENGEYDVTEYANATVNVEGGGKYAPRYIYQGNFFRDYTGTELNYETTNLDTSNMTDMGSMFDYCRQLTSLDVSNFNTSNVTNMSYMFRYCSQLTSLDLSSFDTSNVTDMSYMFDYCSNLTSLNVSNFNTINVTNMKSMFRRFKINFLEFPNFNTSKVTNMSSMFAGCETVKIDLSNFDTSNVTDMSYMFQNSLNIEILDIRGFTFDKVTKYTNMFQDIPTDCLIIVKGDTERNWILTNGRSDLTNVKTVAEYEAS